jgi:hypothetical protein
VVTTVPAAAGCGGWWSWWRQARVRDGGDCAWHA